MTKWFESLGDNCPPANVKWVNEKKFYRMVSNSPPKCEDFWSQRKMKPNNSFNVCECRARSLSVFDSKENCEKLLKMSRFKRCKVYEVCINEKDGCVLKTGNKGHFSWWRSNDFDPSNSNRVKES